MERLSIRERESCQKEGEASESENIVGSVSRESGGAGQNGRADRAVGERMGMSKLSVQNLNLYYGAVPALKEISLEVGERTVMALIGPSGCGKSTFLRCLNRMNDPLGNVRIEGRVLLDGENVYDRRVDVTLLRKKVGMVFQQSNLFPMSIYDNVAYGPRLHGETGKKRLDGIVEEALREAAILEEVRDRLQRPALGLSGGQQQRLCIARALAVEPEVLLMDEPTSALDPVSAGKIEELIGRLKRRYTVILVTHNMQQAARVSDRAAFFWDGRIVESGSTRLLFTAPRDKRTRDYVAGRFG